jgi:crossover junction endodeoxyribonuclease RusA
MSVGEIRLSLPLPPTANHHYQRTKNGMVLTAEAKAYRVEVWAEVMAQTTPEERVLAGDLEMFAFVHWPDKRRRDLDNCLKELCDSLAPVLGIDDSQFKSLHIQVDTGEHAPPVRVMVKSL